MAQIRGKIHTKAIVNNVPREEHPLYWVKALLFIPLDQLLLS